MPPQDGDVLRASPVKANVSELRLVIAPVVWRMAGPALRGMHCWQDRSLAGELSSSAETPLPIA